MHIYQQRVLGLILLFWCSACISHQKVKESDLRLSQYKIETFELKTKKPTSGYWWKELSDPDLEHLIQKSFAEQGRIKIQVIAVKQSAAALESKSSTLWPNLSLDLSASKSKQFSKNLISKSEEEVTLNSYGLNLRLNYEIDIFGVHRNSLSAAEYEVLIQVEKLKALLMETAVNVTKNWLEIREVNDQILLIKNTLQQDEQNLEKLLAELRNGTARTYQILQAKQRLISSKSEFPGLKSRFRFLQRNLVQLTGMTTEEIGKLTVKKSVPLTLSPQDLLIPSFMLKQNPTVRMAFLGLKAKDEAFASAVAAQYPQFRFTASIGTRESELEELINPDRILWSMAGNLLNPIFNRGALKNKALMQKQARTQSLIQYHLQWLKASQDLQQNLDKIHFGKEQLKLMQEKIDLVRATLQMIESGYQDGLNSWSELINSRKELFMSQKSMISARYSLLKNYMNLRGNITGNWASEITQELTKKDI